MHVYDTKFQQHGETPKVITDKIMQKLFRQPSYNQEKKTQIKSVNAHYSEWQSSRPLLLSINETMIFGSAHSKAVDWKRGMDSSK